MYRMPYESIRLKSGKYEVKNKKTGRIAAKGTTAARAELQMNLLNSIDNGYKPGRRNH